jgi:hypothetical protein
LVTAHPRVALTLSRAAVESSIFQIAAATDYESFRKRWDSPNGTGGKVLADLQGIPDDLKWFLKSIWDLVVSFGHASRHPVMSSVTSFYDGVSRRNGLGFAGQYAGPLDAGVLANMAGIFSMASVVGVEAMKISLRPHMSRADEWDRKCQELLHHLDSTVPLPDHLQPYVGSLKGGRRPKRSDTM